MARGTTLQELVAMLRDEAGHSASAAMGQNALASLQRVLRRTQDWLWNDYNWPHLEITRDEAISAGQRYYAFDPDMSMDRVLETRLKWNDTWRPVCFGIREEQYNVSDSDADERQDPIRNWDLYEGNMYEVWPVPETGYQTLRMRGIKKLAPLLADSDRADLDDNLIVLFAAAEVLARQNSKDAEAKATFAQRLYARLKAQQAKGGAFTMGGNSDPNMRGNARPRPLYGKRQA